MTTAFVEQAERMLNYIELKNCGIGPGGFQPGNTCARGGGFSGLPANPDASDSFGQYRTRDGRWTDERYALHQKIIQKVIGDATPVKGQATAVLMGGGPASGKSSAIKSGHIKIDKNTVKIDSDDIKNMLPEYQQMLSDGDPRAAAFVHAESAHLAKKILKAAAGQNHNTMLDGTGNGSMYGLEKKVKYMRARGARVVANYATVDTDVAIQRNVERAAKTGRLVPESFVREAHRAVSQIVPQAIKAGIFDEFKLYDTNGPPKLVASAKGTKLKVHDQEAWDKFLKKGGSSKKQFAAEMKAMKAFCPTGLGGGVDNSCGGPGGGGEGWKPSMSRADAEAWAAGSKYTKDVFHVTTDKATAKSISGEGFRDDITSAGKAFGTGIYFGTDAKTAGFYSKLAKEDGYSSPAKITAKVNITNPLKLDTNSWSQLERDVHIMPSVAAKKIGRKAEFASNKSAIEKKNREILSEYNSNPQGNLQQFKKSRGWVEHPEAEAFKKTVMDLGHDSIIVSDKRMDPAVGGNQLIVFDKKSVVVVE